MMRRGYGSIDIFFERDLSRYLDSLRAEMKSGVQGESAEYLLNVGEQEYVEHFVTRFHLDPLQIHFDDMYVTTREENVPAERFPRSGFLLAGC